MRPCAALLAVVLASPGLAVAQTAERAPTPAAEASAPLPSTSAAPAAHAVHAASAAPITDVARIRRRLDAETPLLDAALTRPTFSTSVTERAARVDIWRFWGEPDDVAAYVRRRGGTWHQEFQDMVTPDVIRNGGGLSNSAQLQLAATGLAFAGAMKLLGIGVQQAKQALHDRATRKAKEEVATELDAFFALHPDARPPAPATPP